VQNRLKVLAINISAYLSFGSVLKNIAEHLFLLFNFIKRQAAVLGGRNTSAKPVKKP